MKTRILLFLCLFGIIAQEVFSFSFSAFTFDTDSVVLKSEMPAKIEVTNKLYNLNYAHHSFCVALPVAAVGFALMPADKYISAAVQEKLPGFNAGPSRNPYGVLLQGDPH